MANKELNLWKILVLFGFVILENNNDNLLSIYCEYARDLLKVLRII